MQQTREFPPEIFARLAPDIYFKRHIEQNLRPTGRGLLERRKVVVETDTLGDEKLRGSIGSAVLRAGAACMVCGVNFGLTRFDNEGGIYPNVEIHRGGVNNTPSIEEQVLTIQLHRIMSASGIDPRIFYVNDEFRLCLTAYIIVLSRTGPMLDLAWKCLISALRDARIPKFIEDDRTGDLIPSKEYFTLEFPNSITSTLNTYGIYDNILIADPDGPVEEECIKDIYTVGKTQSGDMTCFLLSSPDGITLDELRDKLQ